MPNDHIAQRKDQFITARHLLKLIGVNTALLWAGMATADVRDGTYFAFIQLHDYSAVAIDSRVTTGNSSRDDMCKLFPLSEHAIFFSAGVYEGADSEGTIIFSPHATAEQVFGGSNGRSMSEIAAHWARIIVEQIKGFYPSNHQIIEHNEDGFITRGVFAGESTNEGIVAYQSTIVRSDSSEKLDLGVSTEKIPNSFFLGLGQPAKPVTLRKRPLGFLQSHKQSSIVLGIAISADRSPRSFSNAVIIGGGSDDPTSVPNIKSRNLSSGGFD
jgi:hypothetical protein